MSEQPEGQVGVEDTMSYSAAAELSAVRAFVRSRGLALGLPARRADLLMLAVSELATNTLQYTTDGGRVRLWSEPGRLFCEIFDRGPLRSVERELPAADASRGRGLAIVDRVCDAVSTHAMAQGTLVRLTFNL
jgi:serine/threonine-protein kinase RsbW